MKPIAMTKSRRYSQSQSRVALFVYYVSIVATLGILLGSPVFAQEKKTGEEELKLESILLKTDDGLTLRAFYFPSDKGKEAISVMIVHEWQGQASPYGRLVVALHQAGCAVIVPDYRGHGGSKEYTDQRGKVKKFNIAQMGRRDVEKIILNDLEESKRFLKKKNNAEELNLNTLVVIGVREGCVLATHWAARDWSFAPIGSKKRGQDVKGLVLISPKKVLKGIALDQTLTNPAILSLPTLLVAGQGSSEETEAARIHKRLEGVRKKMNRGTVQGLQLKIAKASFSGPQLVTKSPDVIPEIVKFIKENVTINEDLDINPWVMRD
jgi:pimeloyl-ACP methyl ester carboxylesterase